MLFRSSTNLAQGLQANQVNANESETAMQNFINSILGQGLSTGAGGLEGYALGKL